MTARPLTVSIAAGVAVAFGVLTVFAGGQALFGDADMGAVVHFVLWFTFLAGFAFVAAGIGLWRCADWAPVLAIGIAAATAAVFAGFLWHVWRGGPFETRTMAALSLRLAVWLVIAAVAVGHGRVRKNSAAPRHEDGGH